MKTKMKSKPNLKHRWRKDGSDFLTGSISFRNDGGGGMACRHIGSPARQEMWSAHAWFGKKSFKTGKPIHDALHELITKPIFTHEGEAQHAVEAWLDGQMKEGRK